MRITVDVLGSARSRARKAMLLRPHTDGFDQLSICSSPDEGTREFPLQCYKPDRFANGRISTV